MSTGHYELYASSITDSPFIRVMQDLPSIVQQSPSLYYICICLQIRLQSPDNSKDMEFHGYYQTALRAFRHELAAPGQGQQDGTLASAILLCTIGVRLESLFSFFFLACMIRPALELTLLRSSQEMTGPSTCKGQILLSKTS